MPKPKCGRMPPASNSFLSSRHDKIIICASIVAMDMTGRGGRPARKEPLPHHPGNTYLPFQDLIKLEKIDDRTFRSVAPPFTPGGPVGVGRSYGAHVYMQAVWAACQTVKAGFLIHVRHEFHDIELGQLIPTLERQRQLPPRRRVECAVRIQSLHHPRRAIILYTYRQRDTEPRQGHLLYMHMLLQNT